MNEIYYYTGTTILYIFIVLGAMYIPKISLLIDFIATFSINFSSFIFPAVFFLSETDRFKDYEIVFLSISSTIISSASFPLKKTKGI